MGYNSTASTISLTAKLTPFGRQIFASNLNNSIISSFALGDSDANYYTTNTLLTGQIPAEAGEIGVNNTNSNSTTTNASIRSVIIVDATGSLMKPIERQKSTISVTPTSIGQVVLSGSNITQTLINRNNFNTDPLVNLFYSFGLSLNSLQDTNYTATTYSNGGYSDTALSGLAQTNILAIAINNSSYGEIIDGKQVLLTLPTSAGTFNIYSTFMNKGLSTRVEDANLIDTGKVASTFDSNVAMLFCDTIQPPNSFSGNSWSTGFGSLKPFSLNNKQLYNLQTNSNTGTVADKAVGISYLDKGFLIITSPTIVSAFTSSMSSATTVTLNSVSTAIYQNITCIADRGEFGGSTNPTFGPSDTPRISEVALYDNYGNLVAMAKTDRQISKNINEFIALGIQINL